MRAFLLDGYGATADHVKLSEVADPVPGPGDGGVVQVKLVAAVTVPAQRPAGAPRPVLPGLVGSSPLWLRACDEVEGAHTWDVAGRGVNARVITDLNQPWGEAGSCTSCGKCVQVCPTGALVEKGKSVAESVKHPEFLPYLKRMRGQQ